MNLLEWVMPFLEPPGNVKGVQQSILLSIPMEACRVVAELCMTRQGADRMASSKGYLKVQQHVVADIARVNMPTICTSLVAVASARWESSHCMLGGSMC